MEYVTPFLVLLAALAWPIVVLIIVCKFKAQIGRMIDGITRAKAFGTEVEVNRQQTPETGKKLGEEVKRLEGRIEPTMRGMKVGLDPTSAPPRPPTPAGSGLVTAPETPSDSLQKRVEDSILNDPALKDLDSESKLKTVVHVQAAYQMHLLFERVYRVIFGSQLFALTVADSELGAPLADIEAIFNAAKTQHYEIHKGRSFDEWGKFLLSAELAEEFTRDGVRMTRTTDIGHEFLAYIKARRYPHPIG